MANAFGVEASVMSGGLACIVGALLIARLLPGFRTQQVPAADAASGAQAADGLLADAQDVAPDAVS